ncbi:hypothetical protein CQA48_28205, partial [Klebsiella pneumoniae]
KVKTLNTIPTSRRSLPTNGVSLIVTVLIAWPSLFIAGTTLITDWANSQKVKTLNTIPTSRRSLPTNGVSLIVTVLIAWPSRFS